MTSLAPAGGLRPDALDGPCPIGPVVDLVFSRWTTPILWQLHSLGRQRFTDLKELAGGVTAKVLTQRLRQLERDGLVARFAFGEVPPRVEYEITPLGASLAPVFAALSGWSDAHLEQVQVARAAYDHAGEATAVAGAPDCGRPGGAHAEWVAFVAGVRDGEFDT